MALILANGLIIGRNPSTISTTSSGEWENQRRIFWEDITTSWGSWTSVLGTFKLWEEQTKEYWELESTVNWDNWYATQGALEMIEEKTSDSWGAISGTNWENFE